MFVLSSYKFNLWWKPVGAWAVSDRREEGSLGQQPLPKRLWRPVKKAPLRYKCAPFWCLAKQKKNLTKYSKQTVLYTSLNFKIHVPDFDPDSCLLESTMLFFRNNATVLLFLATGLFAVIYNS